MESNVDHICQFCAYQPQKGYSVDCCTETSSTLFIISDESPFRHLYTSIIREFKHLSLTRNYLQLKVNNLLVFC